MNYLMTLICFLVGHDWVIGSYRLTKQSHARLCFRCGKEEYILIA